ncbi:MAG: GNAT family N-acetyltransferase [Thermodesulfobacteriota bacterium]
MNRSIRYQLGIPEDCRQKAAQLYAEAFSQKFMPIIGSKEKLIGILYDAIKPECGIAALKDEQLVGLCGFYHNGISFTAGMSSSVIIKHLGYIKGTWAILLLWILYERKPAAGELWMDGIVVDTDMRGKGVGRNILEQLNSFAKEKRYKCIKLDVIDTNNRAKKLYESQGFVETKTSYHPYLKPFFGFSASATMIKSL